MDDLLLEAQRSPNKEKALAKKYGGAWKYRGGFSGRWECDDGKRYVQRCSRGVDQFDDPLPGADYWLYGDGHPHLVFW